MALVSATERELDASILAYDDLVTSASNICVTPRSSDEAPIMTAANSYL